MGVAGYHPHEGAFPNSGPCKNADSLTASECREAVPASHAEREWLCYALTQQRVWDTTVAKFGPFAFPGSFAVHRLAETVKDATQEVPAHRYRTLPSGGYDATTSSETCRVPKWHARHIPVSDGYYLSAKVYTFDPDFFANRGIDTGNIKTKPNNALYST